MAFRIGDTVFTSSASPATVIGKDDGADTVKLDRDFAVFQQNTRHGLHNDMAPELRQQFNEIMDEVRGNPDDISRVEVLVSKIDELKADPQNVRLVNYLDGELRHIMHSKGVKPRYFTVDASKVR
jgi:hypothetical protein